MDVTTDLLCYAGYVQTACKLPYLTIPCHYTLSLIKVFSALRIFAISNRSYVLSSCVFVLGLMPLGTNLVSSNFMCQEKLIQRK